MQPLFPPGDLGWVLVIILALLPSAYLYRHEVRQTIGQWMNLSRKIVISKIDPIRWSFDVPQPKVTLTRPPWYRKVWIKIRSWVRKCLTN